MIEEISSEAGRDAIELLQIFSFLHHEGISEEIFYWAWKTLWSDPPSAWTFSHQSDILLRQSSQEWDAYPLRAALSILLSFSLITRSPWGTARWVDGRRRCSWRNKWSKRGRERWGRSILTPSARCTISPWHCIYLPAQKLPHKLTRIQFHYAMNEGDVALPPYFDKRVSINTNTALQAIYSHKSNVQKSSYYSIFSHYFKAPSVLTAITAKEHGRKRRIVSQGLSDSAILAMEDHVLVNVRNFCQKMICEDTFESKDQCQMERSPLTRWGRANNMSLWTAYLTFDVIEDIYFSQSFNMLESSDNHYMLKVLPAGIQGLNIVRRKLLVHAEMLKR